MSKLVVTPTSGVIIGEITVPISKYHLHRALIFGSLAHGETIIHGVSGAGHIQDTLNALEDLGIQVEHSATGYRVHGGAYKPVNGMVRLGSSGSTTQFMLGLGCLSTSGPVTFDGVEALRARPIGPLLQALEHIGIRSESTASKLPVKIFPGRPTGGSVKVQGTLSQWISGLLMVSPFAPADTVIDIQEPFNERTYVHLTKSMLQEFGIQVQHDETERQWVIPANQTYQPAEITVEPDLSSAAFPLVYAAMHPGKVILNGLTGPGSHPEGHVLEVLQAMGLEITYHDQLKACVIYNKGTRLNGIEIDMKDIPDLIPILSVCASTARGRTILRNVETGRMKESDRVAAMLQLRKMGACIEESDDCLIIDGVEQLYGAEINTFDDHRVLMAFAVAGSVAAGRTTLNYPNAYEISYPEFMDHMRILGMNIRLESEDHHGGALVDEESLVVHG